MFNRSKSKSFFSFAISIPIGLGILTSLKLSEGMSGEIENLDKEFNNFENENDKNVFSFAKNSTSNLIKPSAWRRERVKPSALRRERGHLDLIESFLIV